MFIFALHQCNTVEYVCADGQTVFDATENFLNAYPSITENFSVRINLDPQSVWGSNRERTMTREEFERWFKDWAPVDDIEVS